MHSPTAAYIYLVNDCVGKHFILNLFVLGSSYGLPVHVRTIFSSSGIGLENFKLAREQYVSRHAQSLGNN